MGSRKWTRLFIIVINLKQLQTLTTQPCAWWQLLEQRNIRETWGHSGLDPIPRQMLPFFHCAVCLWASSSQTYKYRWLWALHSHRLLLYHPDPELQVTPSHEGPHPPHCPSPLDPPSPGSESWRDSWPASCPGPSWGRGPAHDHLLCRGWTLRSRGFKWDTRQLTVMIGSLNEQ